MIHNATAAIEEQDKGLEDNTDSLMRHNNICDGEVEGREEAGDITISDDVDAGAKRRRGRPRKSFSSDHSNMAAVVDNCKEGLSNGDTVLDDIVMMSEPAKRGRGRPRKSPLENGDSSAGLNNPNNKKNSTGGAAARGKYAAIDEEVLVIGDSTAAKRGRGRPRKRPLQNGTSSGLGKDRKKGKLDRSDISPLERNLRYTSPPHSHEVHIQSNGEPATTDVVKDSPFMNAVVKVFCVHTEPNFSLPWQRKRQYSSNSSGFIIEGRRVLTNAHSVEHHTQVKLKKRGSDTKYLAKVLAIGTECDIAMLTVDDDEFWEDISPVQFGELPILQDAVTVVGYPIGGDTISVTSGVVSRIEVLSYVHGSTELLGLQIDAAINAGNSGGPAFSDKGQCVGIAFQSLKHEDAENIGYVIPTPVIRHFITDYERNNEYTGFPFLGIEWQKMENPDLRLAMKMKPNQKGVLIRRVEPTAPASRYLKPSDILLSVNGVDIANDGTVPFRHGERIGFTYLVSQKYTGEKAKVRILRDSFVNEFDIELSTQKRLVPAHTKGKPPSYYIIAGFVFSAVSVPYLRSEYGKDHDFDAPVKILDKLWYSLAQTEDEQLVVISQVLVADINIGYEDIVNTQVLAFNGVQVRNLKHLAQMVENCEDEFLRFDLEYQQVVVLSTKKSKEATKDILVTHCIPSAMSNDLII